MLLATGERASRPVLVDFCIFSSVALMIKNMFDWFSNVCGRPGGRANGRSGVPGSNVFVDSTPGFGALAITEPHKCIAYFSFDGGTENVTK
jgi:hypothetical protein